MNRQRVIVWLTMAGVVVCALGMLACARSEEQRASAPAEESYVLELEQAHQKLDEAANTLPAEVERAFERQPDTHRVEATLARQDLADRAARAELRAGNPDGALEWTARGLALSEEASIIRANLLLTRADALSALEDDERARSTLMQALTVNQQLLSRELENP